MACICVPYLPSQIGEVTIEDLYYVIIKMADVIDRNKEYLSTLDSEIGDGDHGENMSRAFNYAISRLRRIDLRNSDVEELLMIISDSFSQLSNEASGQLYSALFRGMASIADGLRSLDLRLLTEMFEKGVYEVIKVGGAQPGDKTMVDVLYPAMQEFIHNSKVHNDIFVAMRRVLEVAELSMLATSNMTAKKGKASKMAEKSVGHKDPGAVSSYLLLKAFYDYILNKAVTY